MPIRNPPSRDQLVAAISSLDGCGNIDEFLKAVLGGTLYSRYVVTPSTIEQKLTSTLNGIEKDSLERAFFSDIAIRSASSRSFRQVVDAYPEVLTEFYDVERILSDLAADERIYVDAELARIRGQISREVHNAIITASAHEVISRIRFQVYDILEYYQSISFPQAKDIVDLSQDLIDLSREILDALDLLPQSASNAIDIDALNTIVSELESTANAGDYGTSIDKLIEIAAKLKANFTIINHKIFMEIPNISIAPLAERFGSYFRKVGLALYSLRYPPISRALLLKAWGLIDAQLTLFFSLHDVGEVPDRASFDEWIEIKRKITWLAAMGGETDWVARIHQSTDDLEDALVSQDVLDEAFERQRTSMDLLISRKFAEISKQLKEDVAGLQALAAKVGELAQ